MHVVGVPREAAVPVVSQDHARLEFSDVRDKPTNRLVQRGIQKAHCSPSRFGDLRIRVAEKARGANAQPVESVLQFGAALGLARPSR